MKKNMYCLALIFLVLFLAGQVFAADNFVPFNDETITVSSSPIGFTAAKMTSTSGANANRTADAALISVETDQIRWRCAGTPSATVGHLMNVGDFMLIEGASNVKRFLAIRVTTDAKLTVTYYYLKP